MGNCTGGFKRRTTRIAPWRKSKTVVLCFVGVDGSGKTTIVKALQGEDFGTVHPTVGFSRAEFSLKKNKIVAYDLGGGERIREIWPTYYAEVYAMVYVVDSAALSRLAENKKIVDNLVELPELMGKPILFLLNKKDLPEAIDEVQFSERFGLHAMAKRNKTDIRVEGVCAVKGTGKEIDGTIVEGMEWLVEKVVENYANIEKGVQEALKKLKERQIQERIERQHRMAMIAAEKANNPTPDEGSPSESDYNLPNSSESRKPPEDEQQIPANNQNASDQNHQNHVAERPTSPPEETPNTGRGQGIENEAYEPEVPATEQIPHAQEPVR